MGKYVHTRPRRRDFLRSLGAALPLPALTAACSEFEEPLSARTQASLADGPAGEELEIGLAPQAGKPSKDIAVEVHKALLEQALIRDEQRCSLPAKLANHVELGAQVRVIRNAQEYALYTVDELRSEDNPDKARLGLDGRLRLGTTEPFPASVRTVAVAEDLSDAEAEAQSEFVERLVDDGSNTGLIVLAPHGGAIEIHTDAQAEQVQASLAGLDASSWLCKGWRQGGGAYERWHVTSTAIHPASFPKLAEIAGRGFAYAVAFHGMSAGGVLIGGGGPLSLKQALRQAIAAAIDDSALAVDIADATDVYNGDSPDNLVNWLTLGGLGGIQIEQSREARVLHGAAIAEAVAGVYAGLLG